MKLHSFQFVRLVIIALLLFFCAATLHGCDRKKTTDPATGEPSRNPSQSSHYFDPDTAGPGYPGQSTITVFLVRDDFTDPLTGTKKRTYWELCKAAIDQFKPVLEECGKTLVYVETREEADAAQASVVVPVWLRVSPGFDGYTVPTTPDALHSEIWLALHSYALLSDGEIKANVAHEMLHVLGISTHSKDKRDVGYDQSLVWVLSERDKETIRRLFARR